MRGLQSQFSNCSSSVFKPHTCNCAFYHLASLLREKSCCGGLLLILFFLFSSSLLKHKGQSARQDRNRNWPTENLSKTIWCGVTHRAIHPLMLFTHTLNRVTESCPLLICCCVSSSALQQDTYKAQGITNRKDVLQISSSFHPVVGNVPTTQIVLFLLARALSQPIQPISISTRTQKERLFLQFPSL